MHPHQVHTQQGRQGQEGVRGYLVYANLGHLAQEDVRRVDVHADVGTQDVVHHCGRGHLREVARGVAGEGAVEVYVEGGDAALDRVYPQGVDRGVDVHRAVQEVEVVVEAPGELEGHILPLELVSMDTRDHSHARTVTVAADAVLLDQQVLVYGQLG